jgi:hypothetical protein
VIDIFTSEDMENMSLCISQYLTLYYIYNKRWYTCNTKNPNFCKRQKWLAFLVDFLLKLFILKLTISHVTYAHACDCIIFLCILFISNSMVSRAIWKNVHSWVIQRLHWKTHSCMFFQICTRNHTNLWDWLSLPKDKLIQFCLNLDENWMRN